jgi:hypothetical protein
MHAKLLHSVGKSEAWHEQLPKVEQTCSSPSSHVIQELYVQTVLSGSPQIHSEFEHIAVPSSGLQTLHVELLHSMEEPGVRQKHPNELHSAVPSVQSIIQLATVVEPVSGGQTALESSGTHIHFFPPSQQLYPPSRQTGFSPSGQVIQ